jgi:hypothetical protein
MERKWDEREKSLKEKLRPSIEREGKKYNDSKGRFFLWKFFFLIKKFVFNAL